jgi:enterochelin esterase family protein
MRPWRSEVREIPYVRWPVEFPVTYEYGPASFRRPGVPEGTSYRYTWSKSEIFPTTTRSYWVWVPAQYDPSVPAPLIVFQDGQLYLDSEGIFRAGIVLDNLIHSGEMPVAVAVFVDPGEPGNRNVEYDAFDDAYAEFLLTEILPNVTAEYAIADDADLWAICGGSSGGNCAFTVAWRRTERFRRVLCLQPGFAQIPGGNPFPQLIAETPQKPLRIFLLAETHDLNHDAPRGNFFSSSLRVAAALAERAYDVRLVVGDAEHTMEPRGNHGAVILPDALRWLWHDVAVK